MTRNQPETDLRWLISPTDHHAFIESYWRKAPLRIARNESNYYAPLLSERNLERVLHAASGVPGSVEELIDEDHPRRLRNYAAAQETFRQGKSLRINSVHRFSRELTLLCRALEQEFCCPVNINLYFSPESSRALRRHYDTHDVFVLQVYGQKKWQLFDSTVELPLEYFAPLRCERQGAMKFRREKTKDLSAEQTCKVVDEFTLNSGDLLYLPRGFWHVAEAEPGHFSCHLTVGTLSFTYLDLLTIAMTQAASRDVNLRKSLPLNFITDMDCRASVRENVSSILQAFPAQIDADAALGQITEVFVRARQPITAGLLNPPISAQLADLHLESNVEVREGFLCSISLDQSGVLFRFGSKAVSLPVECEQACRFIAIQRRFTPQEIPGALTDDEKLALVLRLITEGLVSTRNDVPGGEVPVQQEEFDGWLPVKIDLRYERPEVKWLYFNHQPLLEPMFDQSVSRLKAKIPPPPSKVAGLETLSNYKGEALPTGFIFHISRCGSTLVSNAMRAAEGTVVISEAQLFGTLLMPPGSNLPKEQVGKWDAARDGLIRGAIGAFSQRRIGNESGLIIKFSSWQILSLALLRRLWPEVPCLIVIRDPIEVMVSCLQKPPGWMRFKRDPATASRVFGWSEESVREMSPGSFCARAIGEFFKAAATHGGANCRVLDYSNLDPSHVPDIARFFGIDAAKIDPDSIARCFGTYSKDGHGTQPYKDDRDVKQRAATDAIRQEAQLWAEEGYTLLRKHEQWRL